MKCKYTFFMISECSTFYLNSAQAQHKILRKTYVFILMENEEEYTQYTWYKIGESKQYNITFINPWNLQQ